MVIWRGDREVAQGVDAKELQQEGVVTACNRQKFSRQKPPVTVGNCRSRCGVAAGELPAAAAASASLCRETSDMEKRRKKIHELVLQKSPANSSRRAQTSLSAAAKEPYGALGCSQQEP